MALSVFPDIPWAVVASDTCLSLSFSLFLPPSPSQDPHIFLTEPEMSNYSKTGKKAGTAEPPASEACIKDQLYKLTGPIPE